MIRNYGWEYAQVHLAVFSLQCATRPPKLEPKNKLYGKRRHIIEIRPPCSLVLTLGDECRREDWR